MICLTEGDYLNNSQNSKKYWIRLLIVNHIFVNYLMAMMMMMNYLCTTRTSILYAFLFCDDVRSVQDYDLTFSLCLTFNDLFLHH